jgi:thioredoxin-related protein
MRRPDTSEIRSAYSGLACATTGGDNASLDVLVKRTELNQREKTAIVRFTRARCSYWNALLTDGRFAQHVRS